MSHPSASDYDKSSVFKITSVNTIKRVSLDGYEVDESKKIKLEKSGNGNVLAPKTLSSSASASAGQTMSVNNNGGGSSVCKKLTGKVKKISHDTASTGSNYHLVVEETTVNDDSSDSNNKVTCVNSSGIEELLLFKKSSINSKDIGCVSNQPTNQSFEISNNDESMIHLECDKTSILSVSMPTSSISSASSTTLLNVLSGTKITPKRLQIGLAEAKKTLGEGVDLKLITTEQGTKFSVIGEKKGDSHIYSASNAVINTQNTFTYSRVCAVGNVTTGNTGAESVSFKTLPGTVKNPSLMVASKKLLPEVTQTTAKVSIGNTTISVPLLKPLNSTQLLQVTQANASVGTNTGCQTQSPQAHLGKILNIKRGQKVTQPTFLSLSQLQIKPVSATKFVQAKVVSKKIPMHIQTVQATKPTMLQQKSGLMTITSTTKHELQNQQQQQQNQTVVSTHLLSTSPQRKAHLTQAPNIVQEILVKTTSSDNSSINPGETNLISSDTNRRLSEKQSLNKTSSACGKDDIPTIITAEFLPANVKVMHTPPIDVTSNHLNEQNLANNPHALQKSQSQLPVQTQTQKINVGPTISIVRQSSPLLVTTTGNNVNVATVSFSMPDTIGQPKVILTKSSFNSCNNGNSNTTANVTTNLSSMTNNFSRNISLMLAKSSANQQLVNAVGVTKNSVCTTTTNNNKGNQTRVNFNINPNLITSTSANNLNTSSILDEIDNLSTETIAVTSSSTIVTASLSSDVLDQNQKKFVQLLPKSNNSNCNTFMQITKNKVSDSVDEEKKRTSELSEQLLHHQQCPNMQATQQTQQSSQNSISTQIQLHIQHIPHESQHHHHIMPHQHTQSRQHIQPQQRHFTHKQQQQFNKQQSQHNIHQSEMSPITDNSNNVTVLATTSPTVQTSSSTISISEHNTASFKIDESNNVLLKQLLQNSNNNQIIHNNSSSHNNSNNNNNNNNNSCNSNSNNNDRCSSTATSTTSGVLARKVINIRAPCLGLVSSLEAQLARPVIPPVQASESVTSTSNTTTTMTATNNHSINSNHNCNNNNNNKIGVHCRRPSPVTTPQPNSSCSGSNSNGNNVCNVNTKILSNTCDRTKHTSALIISKETSFVSAPNVKSEQTDEIEKSTMERMPLLSCMENQITNVDSEQPITKVFDSFEDVGGKTFKTYSRNGHTGSLMPKFNKQISNQDINATNNESLVQTQLQTMSQHNSLSHVSFSNMTSHATTLKVVVQETIANKINDIKQEGQQYSNMQSVQNILNSSNLGANNQKLLNIPDDALLGLTASQGNSQIEQVTVNRNLNQLQFSTDGCQSIKTELVDKITSTIPSATATTGVVVSKVSTTSEVSVTSSATTMCATDAFSVTIPRQQLSIIPNSLLIKSPNTVTENLPAVAINSMTHCNNKILEHVTTPNHCQSNVATTTKDVTEMRKKRKRDQQKQRRQLPSTQSKETSLINSGINSTAMSSTSTTNSNQNQQNIKKRARRSVKYEEDYDSFIDNLLLHMRQMQPLQVLEPHLGINYEVCKIYGWKKGSSNEASIKVGHINEKNILHSSLLGDYGSAYMANKSICYDPQRIMFSKNNEDINTPTMQNNYYDQEFSSFAYKTESERLATWVKLNKEHSQTIESPEIVCNKETQQMDQMKALRLNVLQQESFPGLILMSSNQQCLGRMSPVIPLVNSTALITKRKKICFKPLYNENVIDNCVESKMGSQAKVILSLPVSAAGRILEVLKDLGNILQIPTPIAYNLHKDDNYDVDSKTKSLEVISNSDFPNKPAKNPSDIKSFISIQGILNGRNRMCRNCGVAIKGACFKNSNDNTKTAFHAFLLQPTHCYRYFCTKTCYVQFQWQNEKKSSNNSSTAEKKLDSKDGMNILEFSEEKCNINTSIPNTAKTTQIDKVAKISNTKKVPYQYFNSKCFQSSTTLKRSTDKEIRDLLFKMNITMSVNTGLKNTIESSSNQIVEDRRHCVLCSQIGDGVTDGPSRLLNFDVDKWVHLNCALWSTEVYETISGALINFPLALQIGLNQTCNTCQHLGATIKCYKSRCGAIYHLPCAIRDQCVFYQNKTIHCQMHASRNDKERELTTLTVQRKVYVERDENRQVAAILHHSELMYLLRVGSLIFLNVGQLLPHQLEAFHTPNYIYPIGYKVLRFYWSMRRPNKRCRYICTIAEVDGRPEFRIIVQEPCENDIELRDNTPKAVWQQVLQAVVEVRKTHNLVKLHPEFITGEDLFGLTEPSIVRILESLPGVDTLNNYRFRYGRNPLLDLPLALNPSGSARCEAKLKQQVGWRKPHTQRTCSTISFTSHQSMPSMTLAVGEATCPYSKQFVHSKSSQYKKMKQEWRNNVFLARSKIQGLGLYAARDMEKHTMIIEYIGEVIRTEVSEIREKLYDLKNRGVYMFRLDEDRVVDATLCGGLARYINHSCNPNCMTETVEVDRELRIIILSKRRITRGEELCYDYKFDIEDDGSKIPCMCGAPNCRKWMN